MARRSRDRNRTRDVSNISRPDGLRFENKFRSRRNPVELELEDRRRFHPDGPERNLGARTSRARQLVSGPSTTRRKAGVSRAVRFKSAPPAAVFGPPAKLEVRNPREVSLCVRRQQRKEVLHARRQTGRGGQRRPRWTALSHVGCRRRK